MCTTPIHTCATKTSPLYPKEQTTLTQRPYVFAPLDSKDLTFFHPKLPRLSDGDSFRVRQVFYKSETSS